MAQDVFMKMAQDLWILKEDGYLNADTDMQKVIYHPSLNVIVICAKSGTVKVLDVNSGLVLQSTDLSAVNISSICCQYIAGQDRILFSDGNSVGVRSDYNGVLLLDTILQRPVSSPKDDVKVELLLSEAIILHQSLQSVKTSGIDTVLSEFSTKIDGARKQTKKSLKAQKWNTICIELSLDVLRRAVGKLMSDLNTGIGHSSELGVVSALQDRLLDLSGDRVLATDRNAMASESKRRETFTHWPHMDYKWALPEQMAQAGFYHQPNASGDDRAMCFTCAVCLVSWERTDEPWSEHERHSPNCPFVMGEYTQNVPLSITFATSPAVDATFRDVNASVIGTSSVSNLFVAATERGLVSVFDIGGKINRIHSFFISHRDLKVKERLIEDFAISSLALTIPEHGNGPIQQKITALAAVGSCCSEKYCVQYPATTVARKRAAVISGVTMRLVNSDNKDGDCNSDQIIPMDIDDNSQCERARLCLYLVVHDFENHKAPTFNQFKGNMPNKSSNSNTIDTNADDADCKMVPNEELLDIFNALQSVEEEESLVMMPNGIGGMDDMYLDNAIYNSLSIVKKKPEQQAHQAPQQSGPRLWPAELQSPDDTHGIQFILGNDFSFMTSQANAPSNGKSISDHINEIKAKGHKLSPVNAVQVLALPLEYKRRSDLFIAHLYPTQDGQHLLVVLNSSSVHLNGVLILYKLDFSNDSVRIADSDTLQIRELSPSECVLELSSLVGGSCSTNVESVIQRDPFAAESSLSSKLDGKTNTNAEGLVILVCVDGAVRILDVSTLQVMSIAKLENEPFVSAVYCNSVDRLCASTSKGSLHFYAVNDADNDSSEDQEEEDTLLINSLANTSNTQHLDQSSRINADSQAFSEISTELQNEPSRGFRDQPDLLSISELRRYYALTLFEPNKKGYNAGVPACWSEIQQAQRQRRHPQHLQLESEQITKTWRLNTDTTTWDEHIFELTLPIAITVGHIDVNFTLHASSATPSVQVTLLKQNTVNIGHHRHRGSDLNGSSSSTVFNAVDDDINFEQLQAFGNPVTSQEYLRAHNAEILAGPVNIATGIDLTEQSGCVTLTSPKLMKSRNRTFLIHLKEVLPAYDVRDLGCNSNKKSQHKRNTGDYMGCDCLHEISITVYAAKHMDSAHERADRNAMLESNEFVQSLLFTASNSESNIANQIVALDLLNWIAAIRLCRNRGAFGKYPSQQETFVNNVSGAKLKSLLWHGLLLGDRSIARKCSKFVSVCHNGAAEITHDCHTKFGKTVYVILLDILQNIEMVRSASGLQWISLLMHKVVPFECVADLGNHCVQLLSRLSQELSLRSNPYHMVLRSRFGLYGTPLDPVIFDVDPPVLVRGTAQTITYATAVGLNSTDVNVPPSVAENMAAGSQAAQNKEYLEPRDVLMSKNEKSLLKGDIASQAASMSKSYKGLLETEPLHFSCISASDGTRVERADLNLGGGGTVLPIPIQVISQQSGTKKVDVDSTIVNMNDNAINNFYGNVYEVILKDKKILPHMLDHISSYASDPNQAFKIEIHCQEDGDIVKALPEKASSSAPTFEHLPAPNSKTLPWQQLLMAPPQQVIVVERMHSGARRYVVLDFGQPILLTDLYIPMCSELMSLSIDIWLTSEDTDSTRLAVCTDIGTKHLILNDLQPAPLCRFIKITTIGRYGMSTTRCRIPAGFYYGHMIVLPEDIPHCSDQASSSTISHNASSLANQLNMLNILFEDVSCRYSIACLKLRNLLQPFASVETSSSSHLSAYMQMMRDKSNLSNENLKIFNAYQEAITYQYQLNLIRQVILRIECSMHGKKYSELDAVNVKTPTDKIQAIAENILELLVIVDCIPKISRETCRIIFHGLCVSQRSRIQFLSASVLHQSCHIEPYWGSFLSDTIAEMFSSGYTGIFPQDRVFVLFVFLAKRCGLLTMRAKLDATMRAIAETLHPLHTSHPTLLLSVSVDMQLITWLLLFLSLELDMTKSWNSGLHDCNRWDWIPGEMGVKADGDANAIRLKKRCKRNTKVKSDYNAIMDSTAQALSAITNHAHTLAEKLELAINRQHDQFAKLMKKKDGSANNQSETNSSSSQRTSVSKRRREAPNDRVNNGVAAVDLIDSNHCLIIVKGLIAVLLSIDHSCSADLFVLSCKVISQLMRLSSLSLCYVVTKDELLKLIHIALESELPFVPHALACLIQEVLECNRENAAVNTDTPMEAESQLPTTSNWPTIDILNDIGKLREFNVDDFFQKPLFFGTSAHATAANSGSSNVSSSTPTPTVIAVSKNNNLLPSVFESDDSELDFLDDTFERSRTVSSKPSNSSSNAGGNASSSAASGRSLQSQCESAAIDQRLEQTVEEQTEIALRRMLIVAQSTLFRHISTSDGASTSQNYHMRRAELPEWPTKLNSPLLTRHSVILTSNIALLTACFESLFQDFACQSAAFVENVLQLWLKLVGCNNDEPFCPSRMPSISLSCDAISHLIKTMAWSANMSLRAWCCGLQTLTLACNARRTDVSSSLGVGESQGRRSDSSEGTSANDDDVSNGSNSNDFEYFGSRQTACIVNHPEFVQMLLRLLSGTGLNQCQRGMVGPALCKSMHDFLIRLQMRCDVININSATGNDFKYLMLKLIYELVSATGPIAAKRGPLDAQCKLLQSLLMLNYQNTNLDIVVKIFECAGALLPSFLAQSDRVKCVNIGENTSSTASSFNGIFSSIIGNELYKPDKPVSWDAFLISLLKLLGKLVQTPLPAEPDQAEETMDTENNETSQTDECKAEQIHQDNSPRGNSSSQRCLADTILLQNASVVSLCKSLAACKASSLSMLANLSREHIMDLGEPNNVNDSVFNILSTLARKASTKQLIITPVLTFLAGAPQLSEPFLWFILQVLDTIEALKTFYECGGIVILAESLVKSNRSANTISSLGNISMVMHHFLGQHIKSDPLVTNSNKKMQQAHIESSQSLINFAPFGTIKCSATATTNPDLLIQSGHTPHRRARTAQWSYHFYPEERHTELLLQLPSPILLREVQILPHVLHLSTCPSAVAMEISADGPSRLSPACPPLSTSGMQCIRLHLPKPEVVNCIQLHLYKPRDANDIGLSQIRLLGVSAFGGGVLKKPSMDLSEDENHCKHSLGWLRLLNHCFALAKNTDIDRDVIANAAQVTDLLSTCCGLLLVPTHIPALYLPNLEKVLCELSLYSRENSQRTIELLLNSKPYISEINTINFGANHYIASTPNSQTACDLLCQICGHQDGETRFRLTLILDWLSRISPIVSSAESFYNPAYIRSIASIIWDAAENHMVYDYLRDLVSVALFDNVFRFATLSASNSSMRFALDAVLCSLCYVRTEFYPLLLKKMGITADDNVVVDANAHSGISTVDIITDDGKQQNHNNNRSKYGSKTSNQTIDSINLCLSDDQLETIALVSRSPSAIQQLFESGLLSILNQIILELCAPSESASNSPMSNRGCVTSILKFYAHVCEERPMRDWCGSPDGSVFWRPLLEFMCQPPQSRVVPEDHTLLEEVCVSFLAKCCLCHAENQDRLAKVLCEVISQQVAGISGFLRRLILQLLLENEKIPVSIHADEVVYKSTSVLYPNLAPHPAFKPTNDRAYLYLSTTITLTDILEQHVTFSSTGFKAEVDENPCNTGNSKTALNKCLQSWWNMGVDVSVAAGVTAKDKRLKDLKIPSSTPKKKKRYVAWGALEDTAESVDGRMIACPALGEQPLPVALTLAQVLRMVEDRGSTMDWPCLHLKISRIKVGDEEPKVSTNPVSPDIRASLSSTLQVFSSMGGLSLLAQHLPTVYPETIRPHVTEKPPSESSDLEWVKVDAGTDDVYEDIEDGGATISTGKSSGSGGSISNIPPHSLSAFGLFLRLPGYAEVLLWDTKKALCLLRLVFGITDDGEGGDIFQSPVAESLPTLPFEVLRQLYETTPLTTDDGRLLRKISVNLGVVHLLLTCLSVFTHQHSSLSSSGSSPSGCGSPKNTKESKSADATTSTTNTAATTSTNQHYWAKGTGFGTGSTQQSWNVEQALLKQKSEEEHVTVLLRVLSSYVGHRSDDNIAATVAATGTGISTDASQPLEEVVDNSLPANTPELLAASALLPALCSYLRNDSVLDMARHIPLYRATLELLRAMAMNSQLVHLLLPKESNSENSISVLLTNMKTCVDTYASKLKSAKTQNTDKEKKVVFGSTRTGTCKKTRIKVEREEAERDEGLAMLMPYIRLTQSIVCEATYRITGHVHSLGNENHLDFPLNTTPEERYLQIMKAMQFDSFEMIQELPDGGYKFVVSHHFETHIRSTNDNSHPVRLKRLAQEAVTLSRSLPLSYSSSVFVRNDTSRLDTMKVLITGPADTPYANGCFELDVFFPSEYPSAPMMINLETTGHHSVRFNPNLYNDGKVCLSVLNTWHGRPEEKWNSQTSSFLQVLVSIQSLILVPEPYFNEPGYERTRGTPAGTQSSRDYNANICVATARWAMLEQISNPCPCFRDVINAHFYLKRHEIIDQVDSWIRDLETDGSEKRTGGTARISSTTKRAAQSNLDSLKKIYQSLKEKLLKLSPPKGVPADEQPPSCGGTLTEQKTATTTCPVVPPPQPSVDPASEQSSTTAMSPTCSGASASETHIVMDVDNENNCTLVTNGYLENDDNVSNNTIYDKITMDLEEMSD